MIYPFLKKNKVTSFFFTMLLATVSFLATYRLLTRVLLHYISRLHFQYNECIEVHTMAGSLSSIIGTNPSKSYNSWDVMDVLDQPLQQYFFWVVYMFRPDEKPMSVRVGYNP